MTDTHQGDISFYPDVIPRHENHPNQNAFEVIELQDSRGRGMVVRKPFSVNEQIAQLSGVLVPGVSLNTIQIGPELHMSDPWFCRFLLHSCDPNGRIDVVTATLIARRSIGSGEILSIDYGATEDRLRQQFECHCGARNCRGWMMGGKEVPSDEGKKVLEARAR